MTPGGLCATVFPVNNKTPGWGLCPGMDVPGRLAGCCMLKFAGKFSAAQIDIGIGGFGDAIGVKRSFDFAVG